MLRILMITSFPGAPSPDAFCMKPQRRGRRLEAQQQAESAAMLTSQRRRILQALDEYVEPESEASAESRSFDDILEVSQVANARHG